MRASVLDLEKVMVVVAKQISMVLQAGSNLTSFDVLKTRLFDLSYKLQRKIADCWMTLSSYLNPLWSSVGESNRRLYSW